ncbi:MAG: PQQ-dependent sugar dehydrogenase [Pseudomonadota bacterium]
MQTRMQPPHYLLRSLFTVLLLCSSQLGWTNDDNRLQLPAGFSIERLNFSVPNARQMALTPNGTLIVGTRRRGKVYAVPDAMSDAEPAVIDLLSDLRMPSGITVHDGDLYIGALNQVIKVTDIDKHTHADAPTTVVADNLPDKTHHGWKYLKFGPDDQLYVPVGAPCNICLSDDPRFASLLRMNPATGTTTIWAHGIRNTVGFAWHPRTGELWFSDNGRDMMGDDVPPEEINISTEAGQHFGYPFVHAHDIDDPEFGDHNMRSKWQFTGPEVEIQAHSAALGITFYDHTQFPETYRDALFVAEHGSWNRSSKVGYQVSVIKQTDSGELSYQPFVSGWLQGEEDWGRPNDVLVTPTGALLIADDKQGIIYRVSYAPEA